jgi:hypothetical protein
MRARLWPSCRGYLLAQGLGRGRLDLRQLDVDALAGVVQRRRLQNDASRADLCGANVMNQFRPNVGQSVTPKQLVRIYYGYNKQ